VTSKGNSQPAAASATMPVLAPVPMPAVAVPMPAVAVPMPVVAVPMLDLAHQYAPLRAELMEALGHVLDSRQFILGDSVSTFEHQAAAALGLPHAIGCSSGTDALWLALVAAGLTAAPDAATKPVVLTTPFSFFASVSSILRAGAHVVLADIDPRTFNLAPAAVESALNQNEIHGILPVHLYGQTADWDFFSGAARDRNLILIEDAAQAWGASWKFASGESKPVGALGSAAAFSFYPTKNLSAAGDAGMVTTTSDELAERLKMLRQHGMRRRYHHDELGWNARMDGFQGAILSVKLKYIAAWTEARAGVAALYNQLFTAAGLAEPGPYPTHGVVLPFTDPRATHVWHQYVIRTPRRDELRAFLTKKKIGSEIYYPIPLHLLDALQPLGYKPGDFPESERTAAEVLALPIFPEIREDEQQIVVNAIAEFLS
jgi:dTDP-4-amino-4,6-dideoxygalactose transaminase